MSNLNHVTFISAIREAASKLGRTPTDEMVANLNITLQSLAHRDEAGEVTVSTGDQIITLADFMTAEASRFPLASTSPIGIPAGLRTALDQIAADADRGVLRVGNGVQQGRPRGDPFADIVRGLEARHQAALAAELATFPNPWLPGQINRTRQVVITKADPTRAAQFRMEAGVQ